MTTDDPRDAARLPRSEKHQAELNRLGRSWFAEVGAQSEREAAEIEAWRKQHRKWSVFNRRSGSGGLSADLDSPSGDGLIARSAKPE